MTSVDSASLDSSRCSVSHAEDVWFLSGSTGSSDSLQHTPIDRQPFTVGRQSGTSMKLQFRTVSGNHAELRLIEGRLIIRDLESTNGTYVNGKRITEPTIDGWHDLRKCM